MKKQVLFIFLFLLSSIQVFSQLVWNKSYGTTDFDYPRQLIRLSTGGFLFCGDNNGKAGYLAKINADGDSLWTKRIFPNDTDKSVGTTTIYEINPNSYLIGGGGSKSLSPYISYGCLWNIDSNGNILWYKQTPHQFFNILDYRDGEVIFTDYSRLIRSDTAGNVIWSVSFGQYIKSFNILKTITNTYCFLYSDSLDNMHFKEVAGNGTVLRDSLLSFLNKSAVHGLFFQDSAGDYTVATDEGTVVLRKFNPDLELLWKKVYSIQLNLYSIVQASNKDYVIVGESHVTGDANVGFIRVTENGDYKLVRLFGPLQKSDSPRDACADTDGGVVILGYYEDGPIGGFDYLLVKSIVGVETTGVSIIEDQSSEIIIYPNPSTGLFHLVIPDKVKTVKIIVFDMYGKMIFEKEYTNTNSIELNLNEMSDGIYSCTIVTDKTEYEQRIVKIR